MQSIREAAPLRSVELSSASLDDFLQNAAATVRIELTRNGRDSRAFELLNKTNQFNLNGKRMTEAGWFAYFRDPAAFLMTIAYEDKYGPLGKIAAILGTANERMVRVDFWVMSCRAFSRRIEHLTLKQIFDKFAAEEVTFDYQPTPRNAPLQEFFTDLLGASPHGRCSLSLAGFSNKSFDLFQRVEEFVNE
jgi:FkbH-like protein